MINKETIISVYNEKLTLLQWLKSVNKALDEAVLTNVEIEQRGNATFVFVFTFEDGTQVESNEIVVNKGDSVESASIVNGHLILTLTNEHTIDAGNIKPVSSFGFNSSRHLIVYYGDGTNQDLGLIKGVSSFEINSSGHLIVTYDNGTTEDLGSLGDFSNVDFVARRLSQTRLNNAFDFLLVGGNATLQSQLEITPTFERAQVINNRLAIIVNIKVKNVSGASLTINANTAFLTSLIELNEAVASAIYDFNGNNATTASGGERMITATKIIISTRSNYLYTGVLKESVLEVDNANVANGINVIVMTTENLTFETDQTLFITGRLLLDLL